MRVPCQCTEADYECDMNYIRNKNGKCEEISDPMGIHKERHMSEKEEDCAVEGFYYVTSGYRKIPGNKCYGGVKLDPVRKPCNTFAFFSQVFSSTTLILAGLLGACLYYGWPIIEAIILVLPIPDPKETVEKVKNLAGAAAGSVAGLLESQPRGPPGPQGA